MSDCPIPQTNVEKHKRKPIPPEVKARAKDLYFAHITVENIANQLQISKSTVRYWVFGNPRKGGSDIPKEKTWRYLREQAEKKVIEDIKADNEYHLKRLYRIGLPILADSLEAYKGQRLDLESCQQIADIIGKVDKLFRAVGDRPPPGSLSIGVGVQLSLTDIKQAIAKDFFVALEPPPLPPEEPELSNANPQQQTTTVTVERVDPLGIKPGAEAPPAISGSVQRIPRGQSRGYPAGDQHPEEDAGESGGLPGEWDDGEE